jgi:predicted nucleic acid-binding protein
MPDTDRLVINTGPIIALIAALGDLHLLSSLYALVVVPHEVAREIVAGGRQGYGVQVFEAATFLEIETTARRLSALLSRSLDSGEAAVVQTEIDRQIETVCIDEAVGRRVARLHGLSVTGSLGVLLKAIRKGHDVDLRSCIARMRCRGVWISDATEQHALALATSS